jgi:hypothetical protein
MASEDGGRTARLAVLIDADNAQPAIAGRLLAEIAARQAGLRGLDRHEAEGLEGSAAHPVDPADPAVRLHHRQERDRRRDGHRRHGPAVFRAVSTGSASSQATATSPVWPRASVNPASRCTASASARRLSLSSRPATRSSISRTSSPPRVRAHPPTRGSNRPRAPRPTSSKPTC